MIMSGPAEPYVNPRNKGRSEPRQTCVYTAALLLLLAPLISATLLDLGPCCVRHKDF